MGYFYNYGYDHMFGFGGILMLVFWGLVIWGVIFLVRNINSNDNFRKHEDKALVILKERYAKGYISKKEYEEKKNDLMK